MSNAHPLRHEYYLIVPRRPNDSLFNPEKAFRSTFFATREEAEQYLRDYGAEFPSLYVRRIYMVDAEQFDDHARLQEKP